jgi:hypothetical protein
MMTGSETRFLTEKVTFRITGSPKSDRLSMSGRKKTGIVSGSKSRNGGTKLT